MSEIQFRKLLLNISNFEGDKDVAFIFTDTEVKLTAHKLILKAASPVFFSMFSGNFSENNEVHISDINLSIFELLLRGIYFQEICISDVEIARDLYYAAKKYSIDHIRNLSKEYMVMNCTCKNSYLLFQTAVLFKIPELAQKSMEVLVTNVSESLLPLIYQDIDDEIFSIVLESSELKIRSEYNLYIFLEILVELNCLKKYTKSLGKIRFLNMEISQVLSCNLLNSDEKCAIIANIEADRKQVYQPIIAYPSQLSDSKENRKYNCGYSPEVGDWFYLSSNYQKYVKLHGHYVRLSYAIMIKLISIVAEKREKYLQKNDNVLENKKEAS
uniref:CSON007187 protein n=1 Tax=Culicoides sonorensis TaxID=179676 RepID=A0A336MUB8_CULSO